MQFEDNYTRRRVYVSRRQKQRKRQHVVRLIIFFLILGIILAAVLICGLIFKYKKEDSQVIVSELENIFPNFFTVPYICYVNSNSIERYDGELDISIIVGWMEEIKTITYD